MDYGLLKFRFWATKPSLVFIKFTGVSTSTAEATLRYVTGLLFCRPLTNPLCEDGLHIWGGNVCMFFKNWIFIILTAVGVNCLTLWFYIFNFQISFSSWRTFYTFKITLCYKFSLSASGVICVTYFVYTHTHTCVYVRVCARAHEYVPMYPIN